MKRMIANLMFSVMHITQYINFRLHSLITIPKKIQFSENPINAHLEQDYLHHGDMKPLKLYNKGKICQAIDENIKTIKRCL